jgi:hypothetical protein
MGVWKNSDLPDTAPTFDDRMPEQAEAEAHPEIACAHWECGRGVLIWVGPSPDPIDDGETGRE